MSIITYFLGQDDVPDIYVPIANIKVSDDGCGIFRYAVSGDVNGLFHVKDDTLFLKKEPPVGVSSVSVLLEDPLGRFDPISTSYSLYVSEQYCCAIPYSS